MSKRPPEKIEIGDIIEDFKVKLKFHFCKYDYQTERTNRYFSYCKFQVGQVLWVRETWAQRVATVDTLAVLLHLKLAPFVSIEQAVDFFQALQSKYIILKREER